MPLISKSHAQFQVLLLPIFAIRLPRMVAGGVWKNRFGGP